MDVLKEFVKIEHVLCWNRCVVIDAVGQVAQHQPERRAEVVAWFKDVVEYHLTHAQNKGLIDSRFFEIMVGELCDLRAIELEKEIETFFEYYKQNTDAKHLNPFFGEFDYNDWLHLLHKHAHHHLKQFNLA